MSEVPAVRELERRAAAAFASTRHPELAAPDEDELLAPSRLAAAIVRGDLLVAEEEQSLLGFALVGTLGVDAHLAELDVDPRHGRRGIGSALVEAACALARTRGHVRIVLTTFTDVPFNAPFYARRGFATLAPEHRNAALNAILDAEVAAGLDGASRCALARRLDS